MSQHNKRSISHETILQDHSLIPYVTSIIVFFFFFYERKISTKWQLELMSAI